MKQTDGIYRQDAKSAKYGKGLQVVVFLGVLGVLAVKDVATAGERR